MAMGNSYLFLSRGIRKGQALVGSLAVVGRTSSGESSARSALLKPTAGDSNGCSSGSPNESVARYLVGSFTDRRSRYSSASRSVVSRVIELLLEGAHHPAAPVLPKTPRTPNDGSE